MRTKEQTERDRERGGETERETERQRETERERQRVGVSERQREKISVTSLGQNVKERVNEIPTFLHRNQI
jgi:ribosomal protein S8E